MSWLRSATTSTGETVDVEISGGVIRRVLPAAGGPVGPEDTDLSGHVLLASFVEPHAHLDKALTASLIHNPTGDLAGAVAAMDALRPETNRAELIARAEAALRIHLAYGTTHIRSHVNVLSSVGLAALSAMVEVRERWRGIIDLQLVALVNDTSGPLLREALKEGADVAGGCPHMEDDPDRAVAACLDAAGEAGAPIDLHTDETLNPTALSLVTLADLVTRTGFPHPVTASHCVSLSMQPVDAQRTIAERVAEAGISVVALPQTNLYLQGRDQPVATPRGLTAVAPLLRAGVTVAAGGDNLRDPFHVVGRGDALEVAALMVTCGHLDPVNALYSVTTAPRTALGLPAVSLAPGSPADLVAMPAGDALEALGAAGAARTVWRDGRVVARTVVRSELAAPAPPSPRAPASTPAPVPAPVPASAPASPSAPPAATPDPCVPKADR
ncbi:amidohydrolase family protein [Frankia nepalensis]|uniref:Amidohydrolase family protein n=1 Tax=Frankia nepalensis TaxID=1836974 RepID=A0A937UP08_9ACTN|nr:amidohydrolase family protein [Frankia nepalensis]MBL7500103.1 amidohydrolase family protein [Frankia nepalensis]MBL7512440.1 amidohydrolase family protein [Frankia nepalensis]MBL7628577.1 amidohydrolase family protein [Frankia nepalensis]